MKLLVCMKQVPSLDQIRFDRANRVVREGDVAMVTNPLDLLALAHGVALRDRSDGELVVVTMGPPQARTTLEDAIRRGADRAIQLVDRRFAGADTLATSRALAAAAEREAPDLVLFGRNTLDGATAQVGPQVAELLDLPHVNQVTTIALADGEIVVERETERGSERWRVPRPTALSVARAPGVPEPRPERTGEIAQLAMEDLGGTPRDYGTRGSPTFVKEVRARGVDRRGERTEQVEVAAERLLELAREDRGSAPAEMSVPGRRERQIWVLAERHGDDLHPVSLEGVSCAREVAGELDAEVVSVLLCESPDGLDERLASGGADRVLLIRDPKLAEYEPTAYTDALCAAVEARAPYAVIAPWTSAGRDYVPRAAARLGLGLTGDFVRLELDKRGEEPDLMWIKPAWAGAVEAPIIAHRSPALGTLRPGGFRPTPPRNGLRVPVEELTPRLDERGPSPSCLERTVEIDGPPLDGAPVVICIGEEADEAVLESARALADSLGAALAGTRAAVERGLIPPQLEIGIERCSISPRLVVALGTFDAAPLDAVRGARAVVTVHPDPGAPAHERADLAVVADVGEVAARVWARGQQEPAAP